MRFFHSHKLLGAERRMRGQSMIEFALVVPLFLGMILAVIEIGRFWGARHGVAAAAREGARIMMLPSGVGTRYSDQQEVNAAAVRAAQTYLNATGLAHDGDLVTITPVWAERADAPLLQDFGVRDLRRGDHAGVLIAYKFETPLKVLLLSGDGAMLIKQLALLEHE